MDLIPDSVSNHHSMHPHLEYLAANVFHVHERWPHYRLLLEDMQALHEQYRDARVLSLERSIAETCGEASGESRWGPLFGNLTVINHGMYDDRLYYTVHRKLMDQWDLIIIPNLLHHVRDQRGFFGDLRLILGSGEYYLFDTPFREVHDCPGDYVRYTPYGILDILERNRLTVELKEITNHWEALMYCLDFMISNETIPEPGAIGSSVSRAVWEFIKVRARTNYPAQGRRMCMAWSVRGKRA